MSLPWWSVVSPVVAAVVLGLSFGRDAGGFLLVVVAVALVSAVLAAVHHAEVVACASASRSAP
jgi:Ca2+:H+ antiporter